MSTNAKTSTNFQAAQTQKQANACGVGHFVQALDQGLRYGGKVNVQKEQVVQGVFGKSSKTVPYVVTRPGHNSLYVFPEASADTRPSKPGFHRAHVALPNGGGAYCVYRPGGEGTKRLEFESLEDLLESARQ
ncbi:hypothetical protein B0H11DRAFT_2231709 [Mycena galericulata]|nr:hypothetical protein B0H11DRAFT_2231709 [Mycena galericulata]